jgi:uncharacterized membrane protein
MIIGEHLLRPKVPRQVMSGNMWFAIMPSSRSAVMISAAEEHKIVDAEHVGQEAFVEACGS